MAFEDRLAQRVLGLDVSGIRKVFDLGLKLKDPINFSIGQPDFRVPDPVKQAALQAIREDRNGYTPTQGLPDLLEAVRADATARGLRFEDLIITSGVSGGLLLAFSALLDPGDEVILPDPYFLMYKQLARFLGAKATYVNTYPDFRCTAERLEPLLRREPKLVVINAPGNPTGVGLDARQWSDLADLLARHPRTAVLSDEIYRLFHYDGAYVSLAGLADNVITLDGFSKSHAVTGWRVGWALGPKAVLQQMAKLQQFTFVCAPSFAQRASLAALKHSMEAERQSYARKRDLIYSLLEAKYEVERPQGTFYIFPKVPERYASAQAFVEKALEHNLLIIPGSVFSERDTHYRISFATSEEKLQAGACILNELAE